MIGQYSSQSKDYVLRYENYSKHLHINSLHINKIPDEIFENINPEDVLKLSISYSDIKDIPLGIEKFKHLKELAIYETSLSSISNRILNLKKLTHLDLTRNNLLEFPTSICLLKELRVLSIGYNEISSLPPEITKLKKLRRLGLSQNRLKVLPKFFLELSNLRTTFVTGNDWIVPFEKLNRKHLGYIFNFLHEYYSLSNSKIAFKVPENVKTAIKQYLLYFQDYIQNVKGIDIKLKIEDNVDGIQLLFSDSHDETKISEYLSEYLNFIGTNIENIQPNFTTDNKKDIKDFYTLELKQQVSHLQLQLEFKNYQIKILEEKVTGLEKDKHRLLDIQLEDKKNPHVFQFNTHAVANPILTTTTSVNINIHKEIPNLQSEFHELNKALKDIPQDDKEELKELDNELLSIDPEKDPKTELRKPANRLKRILDAINDEGSTLNKAVKAGQKTVDTAQKLARTYNKIAQWMALPQVPDVFLKD